MDVRDGSIQGVVFSPFSKSESCELFFVWEKSQVVGGGKTLKMLKMQTETTREMYLDVALASETEGEADMFTQSSRVRIKGGHMSDRG